MPTPTSIYQIKVTLNDSKPPIRRRVLVPDSISLHQLYTILQIVMGWEGAHLHQFIIDDEYYGEPEEEDRYSEELKNGKRYRLNQFVRRKGFKFIYEYDFGDSWECGEYGLNNQRGTNEIGMVGLSVGGGASINAAGWDERIRAVVTVGAISHPAAVMKYEFRKRRIPAFVASFLLAYMRWRYGLDFDAIAPLNNIPKSNADFLLIHGGHDETVPLEQAQALSAAGKPAKTRLWIVPEKGHSDCNAHPLFWENVGAFLQETLPLS